MNVLNAEGPKGAARAVAKELPLRQFVPGEVGNAQVDTRVVQGIGEIRFGPSGQDQALLVQKLLLPQARMLRDYRPNASVDLVLGPQFTALKPPDGPLVRRADVVVNVYNTTYYEGLGKSTSDGMVALGFARGAVGLDPQNSWIQDAAAIRFGPDGELGAKLVKEAVPDARLLPDPVSYTHLRAPGATPSARPRGPGEQASARSVNPHGAVTARQRSRIGACPTLHLCHFS